MTTNRVPFNVLPLLLGSHNGLVEFRVEGNTDHRCSSMRTRADRFLKPEI